jgi:hypothetical protein
MLGADEPLQRSGTVTVGGQPHTVTDGRVKVLVGGKKELKRQGKHESLAELEQRLNRIVSMVARSPPRRRANPPSIGSSLRSARQREARAAARAICRAWSACPA